MKKYNSKYSHKHQKIDEMLKNGVEPTEISDKLSIPYGIAYHRQKLLGIKPKEKETPYTKYGKEIFEMWNKGATRKQIADKLGLTKEQVRNCLRNHGYTQHDNKDTSVWLEKLKTELLSYGYEYISGYKKYDSTIRIKDLSNGIEYDVNCHNFIQRKRNNKICEHYEPDRNKKITLRGLYKIRCGICYICGEKCDFSDWWINEKGVRCFGAKYPSIEHKIPRSRGGKTQWDNVSLAHRGCNSKKNSKTIEEADIEECI